MFKMFKKFSMSETGAVSTDWVVLTAGIVALAGASALLVNNGITSASSKVGEGVESQPIGRAN